MLCLGQFTSQWWFLGSTACHRMLEQCSNKHGSSVKDFPWQRWVTNQTISCFYHEFSQELCCCCCRDPGSVLPHGSLRWEVTAVTSPTEDHGLKMITSLLATAFPNFSSLCSSPPSENTDVGGCLHHRGDDNSKGVVGTGSWEEFSVYKKSTSGACLVLSPLLGFPSCLS